MNYRKLGKTIVISGKDRKPVSITYYDKNTLLRAKYGDNYYTMSYGVESVALSSLAKELNAYVISHSDSRRLSLMDAALRAYRNGKTAVILDII